MPRYYTTYAISGLGDGPNPPVGFSHVPRLSLCSASQLLRCSGGQSGEIDKRCRRGFNVTMMRVEFSLRLVVRTLCAAMALCSGMSCAPKPPAQKKVAEKPPLQNPPAVQWTRSLVGAEEAGGARVEQTRDGGFVVAGWTDSALGAEKAYLVKLDGSGSVQWQRVFGYQSGDLRLNSARQDSAGGYIIAGRATQDDYQYPYLAKTDSAGVVLWQRVDSGLVTGSATEALELPGGDIIAAAISNCGSDSDIVIHRTDHNGNTRWRRRVRLATGCPGAPDLSMCRTSNGGLVLACGTVDHALWLARLDSLGSVAWADSYPGQHMGGARSLDVTGDGGIVVAGIGSSATDPDDPSTIYLARFNSTGGLQWKHDFGGPDIDGGWSVQTTSDGGFVVAGGSVRPDSSDNAYVVKTNSAGDAAWVWSYGTTWGEEAVCVRQTSDGGFVVASLGGDLTTDLRVLIIKLAPPSR